MIDSTWQPFGSTRCLPPGALGALLALFATLAPLAGQEVDQLRPLPPLVDLDSAVSPPGPLSASGAPTPENIAGIDVSDATVQWWSPTNWIRPVDWDGGIEFGLNGTAGNSESLSLRAAANAKRKTDIHVFSWDITYAKTNSDGLETQNFAIMNSGYERFLGKSRWTYFLKQQLTYDEFKAFDLRVVLNGGVGYQILDTEVRKWKTRFGAGASREIGGPDNRWVPEAVFGSEFEWRLSERQKLKSQFDFFPAWNDLSDFRIYSDTSWEILLNSDHDLNLKFSLIDQYDSTPNGRKPNDVNYAILLLWKS